MRRLVSGSKGNIKTTEYTISVAGTDDLRYDNLPCQHMIDWDIRVLPERGHLIERIEYLVRFLLIEQRIDGATDLEEC